MLFLSVVVMYLCFVVKCLELVLIEYLAFFGITLYTAAVNAQLQRKMQTAIKGTCNGIGISEGPISRKNGPTTK